MESRTWISLRRNVEHAVYRCWDAGGQLLYIGMTNSWRQRAYHHRRDTPWWSAVTRVTFAHYPNRAMAIEQERTAIWTENAVHNQQRIPPMRAVASTVGHDVCPEAAS